MPMSITHNADNTLQEAPPRISVVVIEDDDAMRSAIVDYVRPSLARPNSQFDCVGAYKSAEEAIAAFPSTGVDIVLMDIRLGRMSGIECVHYLTKHYPKTSVLMVTGEGNRQVIVEACIAGAKGYINKTKIYDELIPAMLLLMQGESYMSPQITREVMEQLRETHTHTAENKQSGQQHQEEQNPVIEENHLLSPREEEILQIAQQSKTYDEIASTLNISVETVRTHLRNIYKKLGVRSLRMALSKFFKV